MERWQESKVGFPLARALCNTCARRIVIPYCLSMIWSIQSVEFCLSISKRPGTCNKSNITPSLSLNDLVQTIGHVFLLHCLWMTLSMPQVELSSVTLFEPNPAHSQSNAHFLRHRQFQSHLVQPLCKAT